MSSYSSVAKSGGVKKKIPKAELTPSNILPDDHRKGSRKAEEDPSDTGGGASTGASDSEEKGIQEAGITEESTGSDPVVMEGKDDTRALLLMLVKQMSGMEARMERMEQRQASGSNSASASNSSSGSDGKQTPSPSSSSLSSAPSSGMASSARDSASNNNNVGKSMSGSDQQPPGAEHDSEDSSSLPPQSSSGGKAQVIPPSSASFMGKASGDIRNHENRNSMSSFSMGGNKGTPGDPSKSKDSPYTPSPQGPSKHRLFDTPPSGGRSDDPSSPRSDSSSGTESTVFRPIQHSKHNPALDVDMYPILNSKLTLDTSMMRKIDFEDMSTDAFIFWMDRINQQLKGNEKYAIFVNATCEQAWQRCGGADIASRYDPRSIERHKWETAFLHALRSLFATLVGLTGDNVAKSITDEMKSQADRYNVPLRLNFSVNTYDPNYDGIFIEDVHGYIQLLEQHYCVKDCTRLEELKHELKRLKLSPDEHPSKLFSRYDDLIRRIIKVYPTYRVQDEGWVCADMISRLPDEYHDEKVKMRRRLPQELQRDWMMNRLIAVYASMKRKKDKQPKLPSKEPYIPNRRGNQRAATVAVSNEQQFRRSTDAGTVRKCFICDQEGHTRYQCPRRVISNTAAAAEEEMDYDGPDPEAYPSQDDHSAENTLQVREEEDDYSSTSSDSAYHIMEEAGEVGEEVTAVMSQRSSGPRSHEAIIDSGASTHVTGNKSLLRDIRPVSGISVRGVGGSRQIKEIGDIAMIKENLLAKAVRHAPGYDATLLSMCKLRAAGIEFLSRGGKLLGIDKAYLDNIAIDQSKVIITAVESDGVFVIPIAKPESEVDSRDRRMNEAQQKAYLQNHKRGETLRDSLRMEQKSMATIPKLPKPPTTEEQRQELQQYRAARANPPSALNQQKPVAQEGKSKEGEKPRGYMKPAENINHVREEFVGAVMSEEGPEAPEQEGDDLYKINVDRLHQRLAHASAPLLHLLNKKYNLNLDKSSIEKLKRHNRTCTCKVCILAKMGSQMNIGRRSAQRSPCATRPGQILHMDLMGPFTMTDSHKRKYNCPSIDGGLYCLTIVDEFSREVWVATFRHKSEAFKHIRKITAQVEAVTGRKIQMINMDKGGEFCSDEMKEYFESNGTRLTYALTDTPEYNGIAERMNRTLQENARALLEQVNAPQHYWSYALEQAALIHNVLPIPHLKSITPYVEMYGQDDRARAEEEVVKILQRIKTFGCDAYVHIPKEERGKLERLKHQGIHLGWDMDKRTYRVMLTAQMKLVETRDVIFVEDSTKQLEESSKFVSLISEQRAGETDNSDEYEVESILTSKIENNQLFYYVKWKGYVNATWEPASNMTNCDQLLKDFKLREKLKKLSREQAYQLYEETVDDMELAYSVSEAPDGKVAFEEVDLLYQEPKGFKQAMADKYSAQWILAMKEELDSLTKQQVFEEVDRVPIGHKPLRCIWVFKAKRDEHNRVARWKARLVIQGFMQKEGIDYTETHSPTSRVKSNKCLLALAAHLDLELKQMDFDCAFLNAWLENVTYVYVPEGYYLGTGKGSMPSTAALLVKKALYGLKQAPREWNKEIDQHLKSLGYSASTLDECFYFKHVGTKTIFLSLYVDDLIIAYPKEIENIWLADKQSISTKYQTKDLGDVQWIFNMKIERDRSKRMLTVSQESYLTQLLEEHGYGNNVKAVDTPFLCENITKPAFSGEADELRELTLEEQASYRSKIGGILYAANITRVDLQFIVGVLARYVSNPLAIHMKAVNRVLRYIATTKSIKLLFDFSNSPLSEGLTVQIYSDSDWAGQSDNRKSTSGWLLMWNNCPVAWQSKKQSTVALSSTEAEYYALGEAVREGLYMRQWLQIYCPHLNVDKQIEIKCDNLGAKEMSDHATDHNRTKHIDIKHHFIREHVHAGRVKVNYVETSKQLADILTKAVKGQIYKRLKSIIYGDNTDKLSIKEGV
jgi:hypothetical protein